MSLELGARNCRPQGNFPKMRELNYLFFLSWQHGGFTGFTGWSYYTISCVLCIYLERSLIISKTKQKSSSGDVAKDLLYSLLSFSSFYLFLLCY